MKNKSSSGFYIFATLVIGCFVGMGLFSMFIHTPKALADLLSAIGTIGAVIVSLYLANRPKRPAVLSARGRVIVGGEIDDPLIYSEVYLENSGQQTVLIKDIDWYCEGNMSGKLLGESIAIKGGDGKLIKITIKKIDLGNSSQFGIDLANMKLDYRDEDGELISKPLDMHPEEINRAYSQGEIKRIIEEKCYFKVTPWNPESEIDVTWEQE